MHTDDLLTRWPEAERILSAVLDLPAEARRSRALDACGADAGLQRVVELLLASGDRELPPLELPVTPLGDDAAMLPIRIGRYRILGHLGRGGTSRVFRAIADDDEGCGAPPVAIKLLDQQPRETSAMRRFERERETLARLVHPGIARLLGGGVTEPEIPYLVIELVEGLPIDRYCDAHVLDVGARLKLFQQVTSAVEYAHAHLVVHRDLKPANVLVDEHGHVKLLDFGIAKWLDDWETARPLTETLHRVLTPAHAAPEQFRGQPITAATDVYQLGLLLYVLLTGRPPLAPTASTRDAFERAALEADPTRPSRATMSGAASDTTGSSSPANGEAARLRGTTEHGLSRRLAGDLDAILLKALRKEPADRYPSVEAFRRDLDDYLAHRPVSARRGSLAYAFRKFARRHRSGLATAALVLAALVAGLAGTAWQARVAFQEARTATEVKGFLLNLFEVADPERSRGQSVTARELLDAGAARVQRELSGQPAVQAEMLSLVGVIYDRLGMYDRAHTLLEEALTLQRRLYGPDVRVTYTTSRLGFVARSRGLFEEAVVRHEETLRLRRDVLGYDDPLVARALGDLAMALADRGSFDRAEPLLREAVAIAGRHEGRDDRLQAELQNNLAFSLERSGDHASAERLYRQSIATKRALLGNDHPSLATGLHNVARLLSARGDDASAEPITREALALRARLLGDDHPEVALTAHNLGLILLRTNRYDEAETQFRRALDVQRRRLGASAPQVAWTLTSLGELQRIRGRMDDAERVFREALAILERGPAGDVRTGSALFGLGRVLAAGRGRDAARPVLERALEIRTDAYGDDDPRTLAVRTELDGQRARR